MVGKTLRFWIKMKGTNLTMLFRSLILLSLHSFRPIKAFHFQVVVLANHQNGRDAHIRQIKVFEPKSVTEKGSVHINSVSTYTGLHMKTSKRVRYLKVWTIVLCSS